MRFRFLLLFAVFSFLNQNRASAQEVELDTAAIRKELQSMKDDNLLSELRAMLDSANTPKSFFSVNAAVSNRLFSIRNNAFNAQQADANATAFLPSVSYFHKSGLGFGVTGYARNNGVANPWYQMAVSPSYDRIAKKSMYGVSYTYYLKNTAPDVTTTPYNHEVYAYFQTRKTWLRPSVAIGWATGSYKDVYKVQIERRGAIQTLIDTSLVSLSDFSFSAALGHTFSFSKVLSGKDLVTIIPQLSVAGGMQSYSSRTLVRQFFGDRFREFEAERLGKIYNLPTSSSTASGSTGFSIQTAAFSTSLSWYLGSFSVSSGYYLGYYFDPGMTRNFIHIFNLGLGFTF
jgi:hypothetical protein